MEYKELKKGKRTLDTSIFCITESVHELKKDKARNTKSSSVTFGPVTLMRVSAVIVEKNLRFWHSGTFFETPFGQKSAP